MIQLFFCAKFFWSRQLGAAEALPEIQLSGNRPGQRSPGGRVHRGERRWGGGGVSWPLELLLQGSDESLLTVASRARCQVWPGGLRGAPSAAAPELLEALW